MAQGNPSHLQPDDLKGRVAIVTGAGRGLGRAMAEGLLAAGVRVVGTAAREAEQLKALAKLHPGNCVPIVADVAQVDDCERVVAAALDRFGHLDILINNAGRGMRYVSPRFMTEPTKFWETTPDVWRLVIDTNVTGPFLMARAAVPTMLRAGWGRIVNVSMNWETMRRRGFSPYGPSKAALESATAIWAKDLTDTGITVNALLPGGAARTGMIPPGMPPEIMAGLLDPTVMVAPLLYLASARSNGVTGRRFTATLWPGPEAAGWPEERP